MVHKRNNQIVFKAEIDETIANSIRRYLNEIPILAIDEVETLSEIISGVSSEVFLFLFKGKRDADLFNPKEEKKSGLNNTEDKHLKAV